MSENYKIISKFIKDISGETPDIETYIFVKDYISKYQLNIEINSKPLKTQIIEINTMLKFHDTSENKKKSHFEMTFTTVIKLNDEIKDKKILQKIILCDVQKDVYPEIEKSLLNLLHTSGYPNINVPMGFIDNVPVGVSFFGSKWSEPTLIEIAYAYEQQTNHRKPPKYIPTD